MRRYPLGLFLFAAVFFATPASSQTYPFTLYTTADGLAQSAVGCIFQDSRGYMWFGTWGGISRYDGREFRNYGNSALHVRCIGEDSKGILWIGSFRGLAKLHPGSSTLHWESDSTDLLATAYIIAIVRDANDNMWIGTDKGLCIVTPSGRRLEKLLGSDIRNSFVRALKSDERGAVLASMSQGIVRCRIIDDARVESGVILRHQFIGDIVGSSDGNIYAASLKERTVLRFAEGKWNTVLSCQPFGPSVQVRSLAEDGRGNLWVGTTAGLIVLEEGEATHISRSEGLPNQYVAAIYRDRENIMWFGTEGGALKLPGTPIRSYTYTTGLPGDHVIAILQDGGNGMWFGTYNGAALLAPSGIMKTFSFGPAHLSVHAFAETEEGNILIGLVDSVAVHAPGSTSGMPASLPEKTPALRFFHDKDGSIWCGGNQRIIKTTSEGKVLLSLDTTEGLPDASISALFLDAASTLWFGTSSRGAGYYRDGRVTSLGKSDGLPHLWVTSINQDKHGTLWFGTQQGTVFWNGKRFEPIAAPEEDLRNGIVQFVVRDSMQHLWFGTQRGIYQWDDSLIGHFDTYDGLVADPTRCGYVDRQGNLWVGTVGGVSQLRIKYLDRHAAPPPVAIDGLALDEEAEPGARTDFSYEENTLTVHFNSLSFKDERRTEFQWMLAGFDAGWQPPRSERHVRYTHLPWGEYEFMVRARNRRTAWSEPGRLAFVVHRPFWAAWWFVTLSFVVLAGTLSLLYRKRIAGLEKEKRLHQEFSLRLMESQENERKRIAGELHDSLGQNLLVIRNRALLGLKESDLGQAARDQLDQISSVATQAIDEVRGISYDLRPYQLDRLGLTKAITSIASGLAASIHFSMNVDPIDDEVGKDQAIHVYRIVQEGINNIIKHSGATDARVEIRAREGTVRITVSDNGRGMPAASTDGTNGKVGFGLVGISERAKAMNGTVTIDSSHGKGTTLTVVIPGKDRS